MLQHVHHGALESFMSLYIIMLFLELHLHCLFVYCKACVACMSCPEPMAFESENVDCCCCGPAWVRNELLTELHNKNWQAGTARCTARCSAGGGISGWCRFIEHDLDKRQNICHIESVKRIYFNYFFLH